MKTLFHKFLAVVTALSFSLTITACGGLEGDNNNVNADVASDSAVNEPVVSNKDSDDNVNPITGEEFDYPDDTIIPYSIYYTHELNIEGYKTCAVVAKNTMDKPMEFSCRLNLYDEQGELIPEDENYGVEFYDLVECIDPGATFAFMYELDSDKNFVRLTAEIEAEEPYYEAGVGNFKLKDWTFTDEGDILTIYSVNNNDYVTDSTCADILYFNKGTFIGCDTLYLSDPDPFSEDYSLIPAGAECEDWTYLNMEAEFDDVQIYIKGNKEIE